MRIWSVHPSYLDSKGLVAVWRETLLARKVISGLTKGYKYHPQLKRFCSNANPVNAIDVYLTFVAEEAITRGYSFDITKIKLLHDEGLITVTDGQLRYETEWLRKKLLLRAPEKLIENGNEVFYKPHPLFKIINGEVETWEKRYDV
jgi:hypothetical protein